MNLQGCGTALITPFRSDGSLDEAGLRSHVHWQIASGISLLVPCGTTGEAATLSETEWLRAVEITVEAANDRVPVFAGCTHNSTREAVHRAQQLARIPGLTGILTANPYYNKPGQEGQYQHFSAIAQSVSLPIMLYNIPGRTGVNLEPATVLRLAEIPNVVAIKESSGNMVQITELLTQLPRSFRVFSGDDSLALPTLAVGGIGLISVASNAIPQQMAQMISSALSDNWISARRINRHYFGLMQANFSEASPAPIKAVMALLGRGNEELRLPMVPVTVATRRRLERILGELGLLNAAPPENIRVF
ncbi:MAG TPA: 4-hydroxy-tetrahydrodipicolinate synthase [Acidobacteriaceae bacterium]|jgi:4-hydroxy-tetrahydrodipicolinate synthase|nr:4-hydroxy-tetrahydrodipicolinate synthase [Acidobacteriaceae bacterium]